MEVKFCASYADKNKMIQAAARWQTRTGADLLDTCMDLEACHCNGTPMDFDKLLAAILAPSSNFYE